MGKTKGKIGNVVTTVLKGQVIAKSRNYHPANPKTAGQVNSRAQMSNAVMAWQFLSLFLSFISPLRKSTESNYNAFIRLAKNLFSTTIAISRANAAGTLEGNSIGHSNCVEIASIGGSGEESVIGFTTGGLAFIAGYNLRYIIYNPITGVNVVGIHNITSEEWSNQSIVLFAGEADMGCASVYIYNLSEKKCSNILFSYFG